MRCRWEEQIKQRANISQQQATPTSEFANHVADAVLRPRGPPRVCGYGKFVALFSIVRRLPVFVSDFLFMRRFNLFPRALPAVPAGSEATAKKAL